VVARQRLVVEGPCPNILSVAYNVTLNSPAGRMKGLKLHAASLFRRKFCLHNFRFFVAEFSLSDFRFFASLRMTEREGLLRMIFFGQSLVEVMREVLDMTEGDLAEVVIARELELFPSTSERGRV
jgi:hypothetical protein